MRWFAIALLLTGCATNKAVLEASAVQPNPRARPASPDRLPTSERLYVFEPTGMRHVRVHNSAEFVVVTPDRLRFHVGLSSARTPATDRRTPGTRDARVWLEDETGRRYEGVREGASVTTMVHPQWRLARDPKCPYACAGFYRDVWFKHADADYVFVGDILTRDRKSLTLYVERPGDLHPLRFVWTFGDGTWVRHHYATPLDAQDNLFVAVPRDGTMARHTETEDETFATHRR